MAPTYSAGSAALEIFPSFRGFHKDMAKELRGINPEISVSADMKSFGKSVESAVRSIKEPTVKANVNADTAKASADIRRWATTVGATTRINVQVVADTGRALREVAALRHAATFTGVVSLSVVGLGAAAAGLAMIPGLATAALAPLGALSVGIMGVGDAFKEQAKATENAATTAVQNARRQIQAQRAIEDATRSLSRARENERRAAQDASWSAAAAAKEVREAEQDLVDAQRASLQATRDITNARREAADAMEELNFQVRGGQLDEREAVLNLKKSQEDLKAAREAGMSGDALERVVLGYERQKLRLEEVRDRNEELKEEQVKTTKAGIDGSSQVQAARKAEQTAAERVKEAEARIHEARISQQQDAIRSQRAMADASAGVADAQRQVAQAIQDSNLGEVEAGINKVQQAMDNLSPAAREFVNTIQGLKPEFEGLRRAVQEALFSGMGPAFENWANAVLPSMQRGLVTIATALNGVTKEMLGFLSSEKVIKQFDDLFAAMGPTISSVTPLIQGLLSLFLDLATAAMPGIRALVGVLTGFIEKLNASLQPLLANGTVQAAILGLVSVIGALLDIIGPLIPLGLELMAIIGPPLTQAITALQPAFEALGEILTILAPVIGQIAIILAEQLSAALINLIPYVEKFAEWAGANPEVAASFVALAAAGFVLIGPLSSIFLWVSRMFNAFARLGGSLGKLGGAFRFLLGPIGIVIGLVATLFATSDEFRGMVTDLIGVIGGLVSTLFTALAPVLETIMGAFTTLIQALLPPLMSILNALMPIVVMVAGVIGELVTAVAPILTMFADLLSFLIPPLIALITYGLVPIIQFLANVLETALGAVIKYIIRPQLEALKWLVENVGGIFKWLWNNAIKPAWDGIVGAIKWAWDKVLKPTLTAMGDMLGDVGDYFEDMAKRAGGIWDGLKRLVRDGIQGVINLVWNDSILKLWTDANNSAIGAVVPDPPGRVTVPEFYSGGYTGDGRKYEPKGIVHGGEFVIRKEVAQKYIPILEMLNRTGRLPGYAAGGQVGATAPAKSDTTAIAASLTFDPTVFEALTAAGQAAVKMLTELARVITDALNVSLGKMQLHTKQASTSVIATVNSLHTRWLQFVTQHRAAMNAISLATQNSSNLQANAMRNSVNAQGIALSTLRNSLSSTRTAIQNTANWAVSQFARIREAAANPIRWVINQPMNAGIIAAWNKLNGDFSLGKKVNPIKVGFSSGGYTGDGGKYEPKGIVHGGEYVVRKEITKRALPFLEALNQGNPEALQATGGAHARLRGYASGGLVDIHGQRVNQAIKRALEFAEKQHNKPYIWGGVGPAGYDCSGFQSAITNVLRGDNPHRRLFATSSFANGPTAGFARGLGSAYGIGVFQGNPGHTAGTLSGRNVESGGSPSRTKFVQGAVGADHRQFNQKFHLPIAGGKFVPGGAGGDFLDPEALATEAFANALRLSKSTAGRYPGNRMASYGGDIAVKATNAVKGKAIERLSESLSLTGNDPGGAGVERWRPTVLQALARVGQPAAHAGITLRRMMQESGGNPRAINNWDVNAKNGVPSKGLMQVIDPTFQAHRDRALPNDVWHPLSNIVASMRYALSRYGSLPAAYNRAGGYDDGGVAFGKGFLAKNTVSPERVLSPSQTRSFDRLVSGLTSGRITVVESNSNGPQRIEGTLDMGNGLTGYVKGIVRDENQSTGTAIARGRRL